MATDDTTTTAESPQRQTERVETPAFISPETWDRIATFAAERLEHDPGADAELAFMDAVHEFVDTETPIVANGEEKTPADVPGADVDGDGPGVAPDRAHLQARTEYRPESEVPLHVTVSPPERVLDDVGGWDELTGTVRIHLDDRPGDE